MAEDDPDRKEFDWDLHVMVPSIGVSRTIRVTSNESVGAVMIKLATKLGKHLKQFTASRRALFVGLTTCITCMPWARHERRHVHGCVRVQPYPP